MFQAHVVATLTARERSWFTWIVRVRTLVMHPRFRRGTAGRGAREQDDRTGWRRFESESTIAARQRAKDHELARRLRMEAPSPLPHATCTPNWWRRLLSSARGEAFEFSPRVLALALILGLGFPFVGSGFAAVRNLVGTYAVSAVVPGGPWVYAHPDVDNSENWYVRAVKLNDVRLLEGVDYTVVDDGSNKGVVIFNVHPSRGDDLEIDGPTLEPGVHVGTIQFL